MRPPECAICHADFDPREGELITFASRESDALWRKRAREDGMTGHPPDTEWFCAEHAPAARAAMRETIDVALLSLRESGGGRPMQIAHPIRPISPDALAGELGRVLRELAGDPSAVRTSSERTWTPMDRMEPPNCPYIDVEVSTVPELDLELRSERARWNDEDLARTSDVLSARGDTDGTFMIGGHSAGGEAPEVRELLSTGALPPTLIALVARLA